MAEPEVEAPGVARSRMRSRNVLTYLRDRWRSEVLHQPAPNDDRSEPEAVPIRTGSISAQKRKQFY